MVALVATALAALVLGLTSWLPPLLRTDIGLVPVDPGLLTVAPEARGVATLGRGYTVAAYPSGFRVSAESGPLVDTVTRGAPVSAVTGALEEGDEHPIERVDETRDHVRIEAVHVEPGRTTYTGVVYSEEGGEGAGLPLRLTFVLTSGGVHVMADVRGADALVVHLDVRPATRGLPPALADTNLRRRGWWVTDGAGEQRALTSATRAVIGIGPQNRTRAVDLRPDGRLDVHVWGPRAALNLSGAPRAG